jgi:hypothetical protein
MRKTVLIVVALCSLVLSGCVSSRITNLTTTRQPRNPSGIYPVEFVWDSNQQTIIDSSIKPYVVIGFEQYPMRPALNIANRWETVIPVPADKSFTVYHFKVDYLYRDFGSPQKSSKLSPSYRLDIVDK